MQLLKLSPKTRNLFRNYWLMLGTYFLFFFLLGFLTTVMPSIDLEKYQQTELFNFMNESPLAFVIMAVVIAPVLEESLFRSLVKPSLTEIYIFFCAVLSFIALAFIPTEANTILKYSLLGLSAFLLFLFFSALKPSRFLRIFRLLLYRNYVIFWIITAVLFGLVHVWNYIEGWEFDLILLILIFPRIIAGYFFGKIKIENHSLIWPIFLHAMKNAVVVFFLLPRLL